MYNNSFTGKLPYGLRNMTKLERFDVSMTNLAGNLSELRNNLTGPIPQKIGPWAEFDSIDVSENFLTGLIPPDMCK
ncbi:hypothetical protein K1719_031536 [Acacia pycnantha]|nr:hypothetical protein K1719_031536 [Acacia pycnantha]